MPTEHELLAMCLRWIENPQGDPFDRAMLMAAIKAKIEPPKRQWRDLEEVDFSTINQCCATKMEAAYLAQVILKERNE